MVDRHEIIHVHVCACLSVHGTSSIIATRQVYENGDKALAVICNYADLHLVQACSVAVLYTLAYGISCMCICPYYRH